MNREILRLAIPNIISNLTVPLLGTVDTALMGHLDNEAHLGAIALGTMIFNFIYWGFGFLRMGTTGLTAQAYGDQHESELINLLGRALFTALSISVLLILLQTPIIWMAFKVISATEEVETFTRDYFRLRIYAAPATISLYAFYGWFMGMQNSRYLMIVSIFANCINILANLFFVYFTPFKSSGIALGTVIAQFMGVGLAIYLFSNKYLYLLPKLEKAAILQIKAIRRFFAVNFDIFIRTLCLIFTFSFFTAKSSAMGEVTLGVNQILLQYIYILAFAIDGFAFASESLVGKHVGQQDQPGLKRSIRYSFYWGMGLAAGFSLIYGCLGSQLLHVFTDNEAIYNRALPFLFWVALMPIATTPGFIWDGIYIGATESKPMRNTLIIATFVIFLPLFYMLKPIWGNHGLWLAFTGFMLTRGIVLSLYAKKYLTKVK